MVDVAKLDFPLLRSREAWEEGAAPATLAPVQQDIEWASHVVLFFPLWLGDMPALLKAFLEQVARPGFAIGREGDNPLAMKLLDGDFAEGDTIEVTADKPPRFSFRPGEPEVAGELVE